MKLERISAAALLVALSSGCAGASPAPVAPVPGTTELTSAEVGETHAPTPKVGKAYKALDDEAQDAADPKRALAREPKKGDVFGSWK